MLCVAPTSPHLSICTSKSIIGDFCSIYLSIQKGPNYLNKPLCAFLLCAITAGEPIFSPGLQPPLIPGMQPGRPIRD